MKNLLFLILLVLISCSDVTSPQELNKIKIEEILESIEDDFNNFIDINEFMNYYHPDFLHNDLNFNDEKSIWQIRMIDFQQIIIENIELDINDNWATATFDLIITANNEESISHEPSEEHGDISYFYKDFDKWYICGKDFSSIK